MSLIDTGGVPFDGRRLDEATAEVTMLDCIERLGTGKFGGVAAWLLEELMGRKWGCTPAVQAAIDGFLGEKADSLLLHGMPSLYGYGVDENDEEAFRMFNEGVKLGAPSGRCHHWLGECHINKGHGIQMHRAGAALGEPRAQCVLGNLLWEGVWEGNGVPQDREEAKRLFTLSHQQGYLDATYYLGLYSGNIPLRVALYKEAAARGHADATAELQEMRAKDPSSVVPFGCWSPHRHVRRWASDSMHREMVSLLMARRRPDGLVSTLPKLALMRICFFVACRPEEYTGPSTEVMLLAETLRRNWDLQQQISSMQRQMNSMQQQMNSCLSCSVVTTIQQQTQTDFQPQE